MTSSSTSSSSSAPVTNYSNSLIASLLPPQPPESFATAAFGNSIISSAPPQGQKPIGSAVADLGNKNGNKFTNGWLDGAGGADIENGLGSLAYPVCPAPYNNRLAANFRAVVPMYGAPVAGLSNLDVNVPGRTWGPGVEAKAEFIPSTWTTDSIGLDIVSGHVGKTVFTAPNNIVGAPLSQFNQFYQVPMGADAHPSYPLASARPFDAGSQVFKGFGVGAKNRKR
jgi:hypothetical protein